MILLAVLVACTTISAVHPDKLYYNLDDTPHLFKGFVQKYNKVYNPDEYLKRQEIFKKTLKEINENNAKDSHAEFGINHFADLTAEERERYFGFKLDDTYLGTAVDLDVSADEGVDLPLSFDWRDHNAVTRVKYQDNCGSSWVFSAVGAIESQYAIKNNKTVELSEQQYVDCILPYDGINNCNGGYPHKVLFEAMYGVVSEKDYNYTGSPSVCVVEAFQPTTSVDSVTYFRPTELSLMKLLVEKGPIVVAVQAFSMISYRGGIIYPDVCYGPVNHAVLLVGYGKENANRYWILKNSWSESWGEAGYFRLDRANDACLMESTYAAVATVL